MTPMAPNDIINSVSNRKNEYLRCVAYVQGKIIYDHTVGSQNSIKLWISNTY